MMIHCKCGHVRSAQPWNSAITKTVSSCLHCSPKASAVRRQVENLAELLLRLCARHVKQPQKE